MKRNTLLQISCKRQAKFSTFVYDNYAKNRRKLSKPVERCRANVDLLASADHAGHTCRLDHCEQFGHL